MNKIERQRQIESDSVRDGCVRWCQNTEYLEAADTKPYRNLIGISWRSLADAIRYLSGQQLSRAGLSDWLAGQRPSTAVGLLQFAKRVPGVKDSDADGSAEEVK